MKQFEHVIGDPLGIHARPAGKLVKLAGGFSSAVEVEKAGKKGDAKKIFSLMALGVKQGDKVKVSVNGADEEKACAEIQAYFKENL